MARTKWSDYTWPDILDLVKAGDKNAEKAAQRRIAGARGQLGIEMQNELDDAKREART